jgi:hypothetical protein
MSSPEAALERDHLLAGAYAERDDRTDALATAYCRRRLTGGALADVLGALGIGSVL